MPCTKVLVKVRAASLNRIDCKLRWGYGKYVLDSRAEMYSKEKLKGPPFIMGRDFSGEIVQIGSEVPDLPHFDLGKHVGCSYLLFLPNYDI